MAGLGVNVAFAVPTDAYLPDAHTEHSEAPFGAKRVDGQAVHAAAMAPLKVSAAQAAQDNAPFAANMPGVHASHITAPATLAARPAGHLEQAASEAVARI